MKTQMASILSVLAVCSGAAFAGDFPQPELVTAGVDHVFVPSGFDDNDNSQVVITGYLPNTCFKVGPSTVQVDREAKKITIKAQSYYYSSSWCLFVLVPYFQTVDLGPVRAGGYRVMVESKDSELKEMNQFEVAASTNPGPDDHLYAPVAEVRPEVKAAGKLELTLKGTFPNNCMEIQQVRVIQNTANVFEVLPISMLKKPSVEGCKNQPVEFTAQVTVDTSWHGQSLIHVRSLNGQALNRVIDLP